MRGDFPDPRPLTPLNTLLKQDYPDLEVILV